jgi:membrane-bound metal-dependent hydrolase YbcI (DUF457 family)
MPSPIGHFLAGLCVYSATEFDLARPVSPRRLGLVTAAALAPDLDLVLNALTGRNYHQAESHSVGFALLAGLAAWVFAASRRWRHPRRLGLGVGLAWLTHVALDYLSADTAVPIGLTALWPITDGWYKFPWPVFLPISRSLEWGALARNLLAAAWEAVLLTPVLALVWRLTSRRRGVGPEPGRDTA